MASTSANRLKTAIFAIFFLSSLVALGLSIKNTLDARQHMMALATLQLRSAILTSESYDLELAQLRMLAASRPDVKPLLATLEKRSSTGIPTSRQLLLDFKTAAAASLIAEQERPSLGFLNDLTSRVAATAVAVSMEAGFNPFDSEISPLVVQAEEALRGGHVQEAIDIVSQLPVDASAAFADWKTNATDLLEVEGALAQLCKQVLDKAG